MTSRGTCLDVSSVFFRPIDGRGTQYVVRRPGTNGAATSGYVDTGISLRAADQLVDVVGGVTKWSRSDVGVASGGENDRGSEKRRRVASAVCGTSKPPIPGGSSADFSESASVSNSEMSVQCSGGSPSNALKCRSTALFSFPSRYKCRAVGSTRIDCPFRYDVSWSLGRAGQGRSGQHRSADGRRSVHRARKSPERIACEPIQQPLQGRRVRQSERNTSVRTAPR